MSNLAKTLAERINGGKWEDPQPTSIRSAALLEAANIAAEVMVSLIGPAADGARDVELAILRHWNKTMHQSTVPYLLPMSSAPKDRPILVRFDHDGGDGYYADEGLTLYGAHADGLSHLSGEGWCVAVWGGGFHDSDEDGGAHLPDWWFQEGSEHEVAVNPVGWVDIDLTEKAKETEIK